MPEIPKITPENWGIRMCVYEFFPSLLQVVGEFCQMAGILQITPCSWWETGDQERRLGDWDPQNYPREQGEQGD